MNNTTRTVAVALGALAWLAGAGALEAQSRASTPDRSGEPTDGASTTQAPRAPLPPPGFMDTCLGLIRQGRHEDARSLLEPVVVNHPDWARAHFFLALTYHRQHRYEQARSLFERALELDPEYHTIRVFYAWCLYYLGELDASRKMFEAFLETKPGYPDAIFALGLIDFDGDAVEAAAARFTEAIRLAHAEGDREVEAKSRARLADVLVRGGKLEAARDELQRSVELNPDNYEAYYKLSRVLQRLGDAAGAERAREQHRQVRERVRPGPAAGMGSNP